MLPLPFLLLDRRSDADSAAALDELKKSGAGPNIVFKKLDVADDKSIDSFCADVLGTYKKVDW
jgi:NAD(P)-dependent dehydrogenase (short-subunit alcohol dehydrogenase family)